MRIDKQSVSFFIGFVRQLDALQRRVEDGPDLPDEIAGSWNEWLAWLDRRILGVVYDVLEEEALLETEAPDGAADHDVDSGVDRDDEPEPPNQRPDAGGKGRRNTSQLGGDVGSPDHAVDGDARGVDATVAGATVADATCDRTQIRRMRRG